MRPGVDRHGPVAADQAGAGPGARARGGGVLPTGRPECLRAVTERNLQINIRSAVELKAAERKKLVDRGYTIIVNMGDQMSDLDGGFAERTYKLPNPFYFVP